MSLLPRHVATAVAIEVLPLSSFVSFFFLQYHVGPNFWECIIVSFQLKIICDSYKINYSSFVTMYNGKQILEKSKIEWPLHLLVHSIGMRSVILSLLTGMNTEVLPLLFFVCDGA